MMDEKEEIIRDFIKEFEHHARHFCISAEQLKKDSLVELDRSVRARLAKTVQNVISCSKEILALLNISCLFCHKLGGENLGECVQCSRPVCSFCGQTIDGNPVHVSVCALWYRKSKKNNE